MPSYESGKIYDIRSPQTDKIYSGSTTQKLCYRMTSHRNHHKIGKKIMSNGLLGFGDAYIELLEDCPCENKEQLAKREGELIRQYKDIVINRKNEGMTKEEKNKRPERIASKTAYNQSEKGKAKKHEWYLKNKAVKEIKTD